MTLAAALGSALTAAIVWRPLPPPAPESPVRRFKLEITGVHPIRDGGPVISPDGRRIVYAQDGQLWLLKPTCQT